MTLCKCKRAASDRVTLLIAVTLSNRLHLYIHDYLVKRQFTEAAAALRTEAALGDQIVVPIDCPQGLLYEWWAVFWDVFSTNNGKPQPCPEAIQFMNVSGWASRNPLYP